MKGLRDEHGVGAPRRQRHRFRRPFHHLGGGHRVHELGAHARDGLDGDDMGSGPDQRSGQLPGPRRQVDDGAAGTEGELGCQQADRLPRVLGPAPLVLLGGAVEAAGGVLVDCLARRAQLATSARRERSQSTVWAMPSGTSIAASQPSSRRAFSTDGQRR